MTIKRVNINREFVLVLGLISLVFAMLGICLYIFLPLAEANGNYPKLFLCVGLLFFLFLSIFFSSWTLSRNSFSDSRFWLDSRIIFISVFIGYFGLSALEFTDYEIKANTIQYAYLYLALTSFFVGTFIKRRGRSSGFLLKNRLVSISPHRMSILVLLIFAVGLFGWFKVLSVGLPLFSESVQESRGGMVASIGGYYYYLSFLFSDVIILILMFRAILKKNLYGSCFIDNGLILFSVFALMSLGSRTRVLYPFLVFFVFYSFYKKLSINVKILLVLLGVFIFLIVVGAYRYSLDANVTYVDALSHVLFGELNLAASTLDRLLSAFPEKIDFIGPYILLMPVLSALPGEQVVLTSFLKDVLNLDFSGSGFTPTLIGGFYVTGDWPFIVVGMFLYGYALQTGYRNALFKGSPGLILLYAYMVVYSLNSLKGGFLKDIEPLFHAVVLTIVYYLSRRIHFENNIGSQ